jgi:tripeptide aminopeptidase
MCFNLDGSGRRDGVIGALGAIRWIAEIRGKSVHAAVNPEGGVSAAIIASRAIAALQQNGWFGRIHQGTCHGTANVGSLHGGEADNQVMDRLTVTGECRSHSPASLKKISKAWKTAFETAAQDVKNNCGECGKVHFFTASDYRSFKLKKSEEVVQRYLRAAPQVGRAAAVEVISAGLDANILNEKGIPTLTFDAGNFNAHDLNEYVEIPRYLEACQLATVLACK